MTLCVCVYVVEVLPLVEFFLEDDITDEEAMTLLESEPPRRKNPAGQGKQTDGWRQETTARILHKNNRLLVKNSIGHIRLGLKSRQSFPSLSISLKIWLGIFLKR